MSLTLKIDQDRFTLDDLIALEDKSMKALRDVLAKCVINDAGEFVTVDEGKRIIGALTMRELNGAISEFKRAMEDAKSGILPPNGGGQ